MAFKGTIFTDGFGVSILKQNFYSGFGCKPKKTKADTKSDFTYIHDLDKTTLENIKPRTVFIDPGRRNLLYSINTKATQYKKLRQRIKTNEVKACEAKLSKHPAATVFIPKFLLYMKTRYEKQADDKLAKAIRVQFGEDPVLIIRNWSARSSTMNKYHEPARGIGLLRMLRNKRFQVYLIDEFKTSSLCPDCAQALETFKMVKKPRPYRRAKIPQVICHGCFGLFSLDTYDGKKIH
ncbi:hypothetical protein VTP01DRAFT_6547 [Rhizomucor pusillus]|uniref:uncharacterized protein n=1 Tax=Rhizomucor pusillus TaxID=4840 RepID=UPI0037426BA2